MKILLSEKQFNEIILEGTGGVETFTNVLLNSFPKLESHIDIIIKFIEESNCQNIEFGSFKFPAAGMSLHNRLIVSKEVLNGDLGYALFVIFHETAHQYQYKKYGSDMMHKFYIGDIDPKIAVKFLKYTENVADQFALRKCRELVKLGLLDREDIPNVGGYDNFSDDMFMSYLNVIRDMVRKSGSTEDEKISETLYNWAMTKL